MELLAPAGSPAHLIAALDAGADAVYLGGKRFSARKFAGNFSDEEMKEAVRTAHGKGATCHVLRGEQQYAPHQGSWRSGYPPAPGNDQVVPAHPYRYR